MTPSAPLPPPSVLNPLTFPLHGSRLIEASAGTGKTWSIAALYLRLVLGHGHDNAFGPPLLPADILVMTFTRAATRELVERIRARLVEAVACFRGQPLQPPDSFLQQLLADYPHAAERELAAWRLANAAESMDDAAIFTIDAWCQRVLREHALDSASLLDETLEADETQRRQEAVQDYWRQQCYPLNPDSLALVQAQWKNLDALAADMHSLARQDIDPTLGQGELHALLPRWQAEHQAALHALAHGWQQQAQDYLLWIEGQLTHNKAAWNGRRLQLKNCTAWLQTLQDWATQPFLDLAGALKTGATRLTPAGLDDARKGDVPVTPPPQAQALEMLLQQLSALPQPSHVLRLHAAARVRQRLQWLKAQASSFGFDDMLQRLDAALHGPNGPVLRQRLLQQYPVALLDEFQDTSPLQYRLFSHIYAPQDNRRDSALLLIGDPKQSIYSFRGADIYSYLAARQATTGRHYVLDKNYRSTQALVEAVNAWFAQAEAPGRQGAFFLREREGGGSNHLPFTPVQAQGRAEQLVAQGQALPAMELLWHAGQEPLKALQLQQDYAQACAERITQWLNDPSMGFLQPDGQLQRLRPSDIAILVRKGAEAAAVRQQLARRGVASVYLSDRESVFASTQAQDLLYWLQAVADPLNTRTLRAALATRLLALPLAELQHLAQDDEALDARTEQLRQLHRIWQRQGVLAMLRASLHLLDLPSRWLTAPGGERCLTNVLHLGELLQQASAELEGEQALIRWLATHVAAPSQDAEAQTLRLESDADLVQVVTIHKSKGLEYPIVMLPFASNFHSATRKNTPFFRDRAGQLFLQVRDEHLAQAEQERLREDLRLFYVALTRPRHHLWLGLGPVHKGRRNSKEDAPPPCMNQHSASGYLLTDGAERDINGWRQALEVLQKSCSNMTLTLMQPARTATYLEAHDTPPALRAAPDYTATFDRSWGVGSFSALVKEMAPSTDQALLAPRPADDEAGSAADAAATAVLARTPLAVGLAPTQTAAPWHSFARGPLVGNFIHDQLQWLQEEQFHLGPQQAQRLQRRCIRAGYEDLAPVAETWLQAIVQHPLPPLGCSLQGLDTSLAEMEFWLPLAHLPSTQVDALCRQHLLPGQPRPALPQRQLHGMLMGFADLVFAHQGRYWVLDYKTNALGPDASAYSATALAQAMLQHRYDVQAALYTLALHRLLHSRLGAAYHPDSHLGGALYFFVRGLDGSAQGVHHLQPPLALLHALEALLQPSPPSAPVATPATPATTTTTAL